MLGGAGDDIYLIDNPATDTLRLDENLWGGGLTAQQVINNFATIVGTDVVFDFAGPDNLVLSGVNTLALAGDIMIT